MPDILLTTFNSSYAHPSLGVRCLAANLGELVHRAELLELEISLRPADAVEKILARSPQIVGFGVYLWNSRETLETAALLKRIAPQLTVVFGGPEISHEPELHPLCANADFIICGEAELAFAALCQQLLSGRRPPEKIISSPLPDLERIALPYGLYSDEDLAHRIVYVEASRGCPFRCDFCLSALDQTTREFPVGPLLEVFSSLLKRGARQFKFIDRTFNLRVDTAISILSFFLDNAPQTFLHFEVVPDRFPEKLRAIVERFPTASLQFEVGVQTFNSDVAARINRRLDVEAMRENLLWLRGCTNVHIHADLIAGLPGEPLESFAEGFDRLWALKPHEIQLGILKRLPGAPIARHTAPWKMVYNPVPPYEILSNSSIDFMTMQRVKRFARYWDIVVNSGDFSTAAPLLWPAIKGSVGPVFYPFMRFSDWLFEQTGRIHAIAKPRLEDLLRQYLTTVQPCPAETVNAALAADAARRAGLKKKLRSLAPHSRRQARHREN